MGAKRNTRIQFRKPVVSNNNQHEGNGKEAAVDGTVAVTAVISGALL